MAMIESQYWGFTVIDHPTIDARVGLNTLTTPNSVLAYTPTTVVTVSGPPFGQNDLVDYPPNKFYTHPFSRQSWAWFLRQVQALIDVGTKWGLPPAVAFNASPAAELLLESVYIYSMPVLPFLAQLDPKLLLPIHDLLYQVNAVELGPRPILWQKSWFEKAVEVLRHGWAWKYTRTHAQAFYCDTITIHGSARARNSSLGVPVGDGFYQGWSEELHEPAPISWSAAGNTGAPLYHAYNGQVSANFEPQYEDPSYPGHVTGYLLKCQAQMTGPSGPVSASGTGSASVITPSTTEGLYSSLGSAAISNSPSSAYIPMHKDPDSYTFTEVLEEI